MITMISNAINWESALFDLIQEDKLQIYQWLHLIILEETIRMMLEIE